MRVILTMFHQHSILTIQHIITTFLDNYLRYHINSLPKNHLYLRIQY